MLIDCTRNFLPNNARKRNTASSNTLKQWQIIADVLFGDVNCIGSILSENRPTGLVAATRSAFLAVQFGRCSRG
jgi:hypothetical protein